MANGLMRFREDVGGECTTVVSPAAAAVRAFVGAAAEVVVAEGNRTVAASAPAPAPMITVDTWALPLNARRISAALA